MNWTKELEQRVLGLRKQGYTYSKIAKEIGTTETSVKHKIRRLGQSDDKNKYIHTKEKVEQFNRIQKLLPKTAMDILETHCGYGNLTKVYSNHGNVLSMDIDKARINSIKDEKLKCVKLKNCDSEHELSNLIYKKETYNLIDVDPYGLPSRFFPNVFNLINNGVLLLTFPIMGVAQINKITIRHYQAFWGIELCDKDDYINKITKRLDDYAFMCKREIEVIEVIRIDRIYRFAIKVTKKSLLDIVDLKVERNKVQAIKPPTTEKQGIFW